MRNRLAVGFVVAVGIVAAASFVIALSRAGLPILTDRESGLEAPFCLSTEFLPYANDVREMQFPLFRELGRQAVLIAARDGLSLSTRDESLGESFPAGAATSAVFDIKCRGANDGTGVIHLKTRRADTTVSVDDAEIDYEFVFRAPSNLFYASMAEKLAKASRGDIVALLEEAGLTGAPVAYSEDAALPDGAEFRLQQMGFTHQFAALRQIHDAIARDGESPARLGGLVRGYTNLSTLTGHYWSSVDAACAARALLYAERMIEVSGGAPDAYWHRAYARALLGLHRLALEDLVRLKSTDAADDEPETAWNAVIEPYCRFDNDALEKLAKVESLRELAPYLAFQSKAKFVDERWNVDAGIAATTACPQAFDVYSEMIEETPMMIQRSATRRMAEALGGLVPRTIARFEQLPEPAIKLVADLKRPKNSWIARTIDGGDHESSAFSPLPKQIADALRSEVVNAADRTEPSWQLLANLIAEEQFVQASGHLAVSLNAVEHSKQDLVDQLSPLVAGHRYAPYISSYAIDKNRAPAEFATVFSTMRVDDPRCNMYRMISQNWSSNDSSGRTYQDLYSYAGWQRDFRLPTVVESLRHVSDRWWQSPGMAEHYRRLMEDIAALSPHAPTVLRIEIDTTASPSREQLTDWENRGKSDPSALRKMAALHNRERDFESAIRCYEASYALSPDVDTIVALAKAYRDNNRADKWLPTLERYLAEKDYALGHAVVHREIAEHHMHQGDWKDAEPHALEAAQTYSAWGLVVASRVYEGLGQWDESERWVREASTNYPTHLGREWYMWCRRTGRGNQAEAKRIADGVLKLNWVTTQDRGFEVLVVDDLLHGRDDAALQRLQNGPAVIVNDVYWRTHAAFLAKRLKNENLYQSEMARLKELADNQYKTSDPTFHDLLTLLHDHRDDKSLSKETLASAETLIEKLDAFGRCNYYHFLGEFLSLKGDNEAAERFWRKAVERGPYDRFNATFAGARLAEEHGTSRPDEQSAVSDSSADSI